MRWTRVPNDAPDAAAAVPQARRAALGVSLLPADDDAANADDEEKGEEQEEEGGAAAAARGHQRRRRRRTSTPTLLVHGGRGRHKSEGLLEDLWAATESEEEGQGHGRVEWERLWPPPPPSDSAAASSSSSFSSPSLSDAPLPRKGHAGVALPPGASSPLFGGPALFLTGGRNDSAAECYHGDSFLFDVEGKKWHRVSPSSSSSSSFSSSLLRRDHAGAWLCDEEGTVFVFGGRGGENYDESRPLGDLLAFDLKSKSWASSSSSTTTTTTLATAASSSSSPAPRFLFGVGTYRSQDGDTKAVIFGGEGGRGAYYNDAWEFGCREKKWRALTRGAAAAG